jgi:hypothetical protein
MFWVFKRFESMLQAFHVDVAKARSSKSRSWVVARRGHSGEELTAARG